MILPTADFSFLFGQIQFTQGHVVFTFPVLGIDAPLLPRSLRNQ